jgi:hypothetical protein
MKMTDLRAKARAIFGSAIAEPMPKQPNGAKALQERANARPIPTYKVGGVVKKQSGGAMPPRARGGSPEADDVLITTRRGREMEAELRRREAMKKKAEEEKRARADKLLGIPAQKKGGKAGMYADGGKVMDERIAARMAAGNYKKGGKAKKDGLAVMIAIGAPMKSMKKPIKEKATGEMYSSKKAMAKHEAKESPMMEKAERMMKPVKRAVGGRARAPMKPPVGLKTRAKAEEMMRMAQAASKNAPAASKSASAAGLAAALMGAKKAAPMPMPAKSPSRVPADYYDDLSHLKNMPASPVPAGRTASMPMAAKAAMPSPAPRPAQSAEMMAAGGAGKTRKGQAPVKRAVGGAGKTRKGMMK